MRIGVAGLGGMGVLHARNAARTTGAQLVAVASTRPAQSQAISAELGVRAATYAQLIAADDIDGVVVAARSVDHAAVAAEVLRAGKHLLLEKPGATTVADHEALRSEAQRRPDTIVQVGYQRRFDPEFRELQRLVSSGAIGEPLLVIATSRDMRAPEPEDPLPAGGFLLDMASHDYDTACWLLGQEPIDVDVTRQALVYPELTQLGDLDNAIVTVAFDGGAMATTHASRTCVYGHDIRTEVVGTDGSAFVGNAASTRGVTVVTKGQATEFPADYRERFANAYRAELDAFVAACTGRTNGTEHPSLDDDRRAVAVGVAARSSAVAGVPRKVGVDWPWPEDPAPV
jgi:predicted dehydrogenase